MFKTVKNQAGAVSAAHPLAAEAGTRILHSGGNAFDAAVTVAAVLNVVEPQNSGMGGYGTILIHDAEKNRTHFLDSSGRIPRKVDSDAFRPPAENYRANRRGAKAVSTPGNVNAWMAISEKYGNLQWADLFVDAIRIAGEGFPISPALSGSIAYAFYDMPAQAREIYGRRGEPLGTGEILVQRDLARSLRLVAERGVIPVYRGEIGRAVDRVMKDMGGFLRLEDLEEDRAEWWEPIGIDYRGYRVVTASPPSTAFPSLIRLGLMSCFDCRALGHNSAAFLHLYAEATKHAFWCRLAYAGDPESHAPPLSRLLSRKYWEKIARNFDRNQAAPFKAPEIVCRSVHTTHFCVADGWGNIVSATQTLGRSFGSRILVPGTGIWLNNSLAYCTFEPKGNPMDAHPGQRKLSGDCPTIVFKEEKPLLALGTPGGHTIGQTVPQMLMNVIDFGMDIVSAIAAPRISFIQPDVIVVESGISQEVSGDLERRGHRIERGGRLGNAHGLMIVYDNEGKILRFIGAADPRGEGRAISFSEEKRK